MEVTRSNYDAVAPQIEHAMKNCDFISIDTEFTGLELPNEEACCLFDNPSERYEKEKQSVRAFTLVQVGIGCFKKIPDLNKYESVVFNIFVFPASIGKYNSVFSSQCSSIEFLCRNGFDFNKSFCEGVPFLKQNDVESLRSDLEAGIVGQKEIDINYFSDMCQLLTEWLSKADVGQTNEVDALPLGTGPRRWIFEYELLRTFSQIRITVSDNVKLVVEKCSEVECALRDQERQILLQKISKEFTGCANLFELLITAKKPVIGQNLLLDLMFFYEKFYEGLPEKYDEFKNRMRALLPEIYDTKQIATAMRKNLDERGCKKFGLGSLYSFLETEKSSNHIVLFQPYVELTKECRRYASQQCLHEAGFDAYAVGVVFIRLAHMQAMSALPTPSAEPLEYADHIKAVKPFANRLNLINAAVSYMNLGGADPISLRPDWLLVSSKRFQKLDRLRLVAELSRFGSFDLRPLSSSKALVAVAGHSTAQAMLEKLQTSEHFSIRKYGFYVRARTEKKTALAAVVVAIGVLACAWSWETFSGRSIMKKWS